MIFRQIKHAVRDCVVMNMCLVCTCSGIGKSMNTGVLMVPSRGSSETQNEVYVLPLHTFVSVLDLLA